MTIFVDKVGNTGAGMPLDCYPIVIKVKIWKY